MSFFSNPFKSIRRTFTNPGKAAKNVLHSTANTFHQAGSLISNPANALLPDTFRRTSFYRNVLRPGVKVGTAAGIGYLAGRPIGALLAGGLDAATGGLTDKGFQPIHDVALPTAVGLPAGAETGAGLGGQAADALSGAGAGAGATTGAGAGVGSAGSGLATTAIPDAVTGLPALAGPGAAPLVDLPAATVPSSGLSLSSIGGSLSNLASNAINTSTLEKAALGAGASYLLSPKPPTIQGTDAATLDAATLPQLNKDINQRIAELNSKISAQGGLSSADAAELASLRVELARQLGQQKAVNKISANTSTNNAALQNYTGNRQRFSDILTGGLVGAQL